MSSNRPNLDEIKARSRGAGPKGYFVMTLVRPIGPYLAWVALRLGLAPRHVTYFSLAASWALIVYAMAGGHAGLVWAPALIIVWEMIDVTDGTMARALGIRDNFGGFVDYVAGITLVAFLPLALGIGAALSPDGSLLRLLQPITGTTVVSPIALAAIGGAISAISAYMRIINRTLQVRFGDSLAGEGPEAAGSDTGLKGAIRTFVRNVETVGGFQAIIFAAGAALNALEVVLFGYLVFYVLLLGAFAVSVYRGFGRRTAYLR